ncbi:hypothetical protein HLB23_23640 [Nocardia uniformis]|uniref:Uncharacterized protein n=1 Tax=Nocardia uniformis TaxID=53432 RepID=A0A849C246_9NOCA|nr:hypothetical protein [Nocardia uniformis]NNH72813.1 hypothetical protein [Nocardia uniformis]
MAIFDALAANVVANVEIVAAVADSTPESDPEPPDKFWHEHTRILLTEVRPDTDADLLATLLLNTLSGSPVLRLIRDGHGTRYIDSVRTLITSVISAGAASTHPSAAS